MYCNLGIHTDLTLGRSAIRFKHLKGMQFDSPMAICDNGNMSQMVKSLLLNKMNIPAVELYIVQSYADKSRPNAVARFFASDLQGYESLCKMVEIAARNKYYSPRLEINDIILDGDVTAIVDEDFIFLEEFPREKTFVAVNAESNLANPVYLRNNPIFYYDSYALHQSDLGIIELLSARQFKHETKCWYYDLSHFAAASMIQGAVENYCALCSRHTAPVISFENRYPIFEPSTEETFDALIEAGFARKCAGKGPEYRERLDFEAGVIKRMGYTSYFNINWDFIHWAREHDIPIGPGRGSAAGSLVAYCLDITKLDPVANGLYFERFLNPERVSPPDIDTDIAANDRQRVIEYVRTRYGRDRVSQIVSFSVLKSKSALKDAARLFAIPAEEMDGITKQFPLSVAGEPPTLEDAYEVAGVQAWANRHPLVWKEAKNLEGFIRQTTVNAAGVIIAPKPLRELTGMSYVDDEYVCQLDKVDSEKFGLLKMDLLGLITLDVIKLTLEQLGKSYYDMENTPLDDAKVIAEFAKGNTYGIFQFESGGMRKLLIQVAPKTFADIAATTAFYRPGPLNSGLTTQYVHNRHSSNPIYFLPEFKELLAETAGVFVYQEQVMAVAQSIAGFSLSRADNLRKAIGKKDHDLMIKMEDEFVSGCVAHEFPEEKARKLWSQIVSFADYCFNKSHSYAYALLSYWSMYLKVYHPAEFAASLLTANMKSTSDLRASFSNLKEIVTFHAPSVNEANTDFMLSKRGGVMTGLGAIKGMGNSADAIVKHQPYQSIADFLEKVRLDKTQLTTLIYAGSFDCFELNKNILLGNLDRMLKFAKTSVDSDIYSLFSASEVFGLDKNKQITAPDPGFMEKTCYGFNFAHGFMAKNEWLITRLQPDSYIGTVIDIKRTKTVKDKKDMAILTVETYSKIIKVLLCNNAFTDHINSIEKEATYGFVGQTKYGETEDDISVFAKDVYTDAAITPTAADLYLDQPLTKQEIHEAMGIVKPGICAVRVHDIRSNKEGEYLFTLPQEIYFNEPVFKRFDNIGIDLKFAIS